MKKSLIILVTLFLSISVLPQVQSKAADSVVINVGKESKIIIVVSNKQDLETLKNYDFQSLMDDIIARMESQDTTSAMKPSVAYLKDSVETNPALEKKEEEDNWKTLETKEQQKRSKDISVKDRSYHRGPRQSVSFDFGTNNYLSNGKFPDAGTDLYTVRPWGSWYLGVNSVHRSRLARTFFLEWGFGLSMYNFKFQNEAIMVSKDVNSVIFSEDTRAVDFRKSKLSASYINASFVPVIDFGGNRRKPVWFDGRRSDSFRIGFGPYAGYRLDSYTKKVFKENGDKKKEKDHDSFYLNNFRYGLRLQLGFKDTDLFFNYDLNNLFVNNKGPMLNAFSFGVSF